MGAGGTLLRVLNLLQLGIQPQLLIDRLAKKYGPLMYIRMGSISNVVVSSPKMAKEILQKHGQVFTGRPDGQAMQVCDQSKLSVAFLPVGGEWRLLRKIMKEELFSHPSMEAGEGLRKQKLQQLVDYVQKCCDSGRAVAIREAASITALNLISATLFSTEAIELDSEGIMELKELLEGATLSIGMPNLADYFLILKPFDPQGIKRTAKIYYGTLLRKVEAYLSQRVESKNKHNAASKKHHDLMETLLDLVEGNKCGQLTLKHLAHLLKDSLIGGSGSTASVMEWIMSELVLNLDVMAKVKAEVKSVAGDKRLVKQSDIPRLPYPLNLPF